MQESRTRRLAGVGRAATAPARELAGLWRRSIQARVVIGTLTLSAVLAILAGWILLRQVTDGVLTSKQQAAITQASAGVDTAQAELDAPETGNVFEPGPVLNQLIEQLSLRAEAQDNYYIVIIGPIDTFGEVNEDTGIRASSVNIDPARSVPADLVAKVQSEPGVWNRYAPIYLSPPDDVEPGLIVGSRIQLPSSVSAPGQTYALFYVFSLREQEQTLFVVRGALITTGSLLLVLLGTIAWLVTRQVVTPVRLARRIAERLAAGRLEERMHVRGEDDIARLGQSFNQMAASLQRQIRQLEELSRVQRRFVADVSHELRTPLTTVRLASDVLHDARHTFDPVTSRSAELLQAELDRFEGLLTELLEISRFDAGAVTLELADVDLREVARRVVDGAAALARQRGSRVTVTAPHEPCVAQADVRRIERIMRNLVVNAIEYGEGRDVEVSVAGSAEAVAATVRDHGVGLKPGEEVMVFNRFWRADPARARTRGGTGLGLSIAVEDTMLHTGKLDAWGEPGVGSVFRLTLPRRAGEPVIVSPLSLVPEERSPVAVGAPYARYGPDRRRSS
ncbi:MAG: HAMP domain-containing histidine kinase [Nocardioidaceae bacterium]|nr:HAMP domain-containing histidine kinase [Nocardioidaceae bacterium]